MNIYRVTRKEYSDDFSGQGAFLYGGRWNSKGQQALYCAAHISLAVLEIVVNYDRSHISLLPTYHLVQIQIPDNAVSEIDTSVLKKKWINDLEYTKYIGDEFLLSKSALALKVPSAVIPEECNYLVNPNHADYKKMKVMVNKAYGMDNRLF